YEMKGQSTKATPGRPKTLDRDHVLHVAINSYWSEGPTAISINEICRRAGVSKPGLYREFGGEDGLKRAALDAYRDNVLTILFQIFDADIPFGDAIDALIELTTQDRAAMDIPMGCLFEQMRVCCKKFGPKTNAAINYTRTNKQARIEDWINRAKENGQMAAQISTPIAALYVSSQITSVIMMQAEGVSSIQITEFLKFAFNGWGRVN
ncbi:MAG: TetR/AcrR family transcriptional regulator, partial [Rhodospirillales bacterium]|nr:TetR/AcrR family transcriptional regulator [Rhodospirillales bacterium]